MKAAFLPVWEGRPSLEGVLFATGLTWRVRSAPLAEDDLICVSFYRCRLAIFNTVPKQVSNFAQSWIDLKYCRAK